MPLEMAADGSENTVTITVTAPAGNTKTYTFHIQRLGEPVMEYAPGNTPAGMLATDPDQTKLTTFADSRKWETGKTAPSTVTPLYTGQFAKAAWGDGEDLDLNETAIVVYQNSAVTLPALTVYNSQGVDVTRLAGGVRGTLTRVWHPRTVDKLTTDVVTGEVEPVSVEDRSEIIPGTDETLDLQGVNVVPGIYTLEYTYEDPVADKTYSTKKGAFAVNGDNAATFSRTLVVLPIPGDVTMDGQVTPADAEELNRLLTEEYVDPLFLYRVCAANLDDQVNSDDVDTLRQGNAVRADVSPSDYFYYPLNYPSDPFRNPRTLTRQPMPEAQTGEVEDGKARLSVVYVGKGETLEDAEKNYLANLAQGDVFWVGVELENAAALSKYGALNSFTVTLGYDSTYLTPYAGDIEEANRAYWGNAYQQDLLHTAEYAVADEAKAKPTIGTEGDASAAKLREVRLTVAGSGKTLVDGYVLLMPFTLSTFNTTGGEGMLEPAFGPRELGLSGTEGAAFYSVTTSVFGGVTENLADRLEYGGAEELPLGEDNTGYKHEWTVIYGDQFDTGDTSAYVGVMDAGEDVTEWLNYDYKPGDLHSRLWGTPKAVGDYDFYLGRNRYAIHVVQRSVTLTLAAQERYYGEENPDPMAVYTYAVGDLASWDRETLGGDDLTGAAAELGKLSPAEGYTAPTVSYLTALTGGTEVTADTNANGEGETYFILLTGASAVNYTFRYAVAGAEGTETDRCSATLTVHKRPIRVEKITAPDPVCEINETATGLVVSGLVGDYPGDGTSAFTVVLPVLSNGLYGGMALTGDPVHTRNGTFDRLRISYEASYQEDNATRPYFTLTDLEETRPVTVRQLALTGTDNDNDNYVLVNATGESHEGMMPVEPTAQGLVFKRYIKEMDITQLVNGSVDNDTGTAAEGILTYTHGESMYTLKNGFKAEVRYSDETESDQRHTVMLNGLGESGLTAFFAKLGEDGKPTGDRVPIENDDADLYADRATMDGCYLWVAATGNVDGETAEITARSKLPLAVAQKTLTLTVQAERRYYGETDRAGWADVRYSTADLSPADRDGMTGDFLADFPDAGLAVRRVTALTGGAAVESSTQVGSYYVTVTGAAHVNYAFQYTRLNATGGTNVDSALGSQTLTILPRPIIVTKVAATPQSIFSDTTLYQLPGQTAATAAGEVTLALPTAAGSYYRQTGAANEGVYGAEPVIDSLLPLTGAALRAGDQLSFTYTATYLRDSTTTLPYFNLTTETKTYPVDVTEVELTGALAGNYVLYFTCSDNAMYGYPGTGSTENIAEHRITGTVKLRKVTSVEILTPLPRLSYIHGDSLDMRQDAGTGQSALRVRINYEGDVDSVIVTYDGPGSTGAFARNRLHLTWDTHWSADLSANRVILEGESLELTYAYHNGRKLYVTMEQLGGLDPVWAEPLTVEVAKKDLTLTASDQNRYYGEPDSAYVFTFAKSELARQDQRYLDGDSITDYTGGASDSTALRTINERYSDADGVYEVYENPTFTPVAANSAAGGGDEADGAYTLALTGGVMTNYNIICQSGKVRVFRRPIRVMQVMASPVASLSVDETTNFEISTYLTESGNSANIEIARPNSGGATGYASGNYDAVYQAAMGSATLPLTGDALVAGDSVTISFTAVFPAKTNWPSVPSGDAGVDCDVTIRGMTLSADSSNYILVYNDSANSVTQRPVTNTATGWLSARTIVQIEKKSWPALNFTYGEALTAAKLATIQLDVTYDGATNSGAVLINDLEVAPEMYYWDTAWNDLIPVRQEGEEDEAWRTRVETFFAGYSRYKVTVGERMYIKNPNGVSHQGMRLLLLFKNKQSSDAVYLPPIISEQAITIAQKQLTYTVRANDRAYNGSNGATGTLTLNPSSICEGDQVSVKEGTTFTFVDRNVRYVTPPGDHSYGAIDDMPVEVTNIAIEGAHADNYTIVDRIRQSDPGAPRARITKAVRPAPTLDDIRLSTDIRTNVVTVDPNGTTGGNAQDDHNAGVHLEYNLEYLDEEDVALWVGEWQDTVWFGGEKVTGTEGPWVWEAADAQSAAAGDTGFGSRAKLLRDTWYRAGVRIGETWNYQASAITYSAAGDLATLALAAQAELDSAPPPGQKDHPVSRSFEPLTKTYTYRMDVLAEEAEPAAGTKATVGLNAVWFTDVGTYATQKDLDQVLDNVDDKPLYYDYYWDDSMRTRLRFPLDVTERIEEELQLLDGTDANSTTRETVWVNKDDTMTLYAAIKPSGSGDIMAESLIPSMTEVEAAIGDEPIQLTVTYKPASATPGVRWQSSDTEVVQVDAQGWLTFVGEGEAVITVKANFGRAMAEIYVTVTDPEKTGEPEDENPTFLDRIGTESFMTLDSAFNFYPEDTITRGEVVMAFYAVFRVPPDTEPGPPVIFADVRPDDPYFEAAAVMSSYGIITGVENGDFAGELTITRAEVVVMLARMLRILPEENAVSYPFVDGAPDVTWAAPYLNSLYKAGIVRGTGEGYFEPGRAITRAEVAAFIARMLETYADMDSAELIVPADVGATHWAYESVLRAVNSGGAVLVTEIETETESQE